MKSNDARQSSGCCSMRRPGRARLCGINQSQTTKIEAMNDKLDVGSEILRFFVSIGSYISAITIGLFGKIGLEAMLKKRYTLTQWAGIVLISIFFGYLASILCENYGWEHAQHWLPSIATMFGQNIALYVSANYSRIFSALIDTFVRNRK